jgi:hypothetical protein
MLFLCCQNVPNTYYVGLPLFSRLDPHLSAAAHAQQRSLAAVLPPAQHQQRQKYLRGSMQCIAQHTAGTSGKV